MITKLFLFCVLAAVLNITLTAQCSGSWTPGTTLNYLCADGPFLKFETGDCPATEQSTFTFTAPVQSVKLIYTAFGSSGDTGESRLALFLNGNKVDLRFACKITVGCQEPAGAYSINGGCLVDSVAGFDFGISGGIYINAPDFGLGSIATLGVAVSEPFSTGTIFAVDSCNANFGCTTSVSNISQQTVSFQPNPFTDQLIVNAVNTQPSELIIYNITAQIIFKESFQGTLSLNTTNWQKGMYIYTIGSNGKITETGKIVKSE